jgi:putative glutamine amidotransferase
MIGTLIGVTQRVDIIPRGEGMVERRDALDQAWVRFLNAAGFRAVPLPNHAPTALALFNGLPLRGLLLTGGNDLIAYDGDAPERDATESALLGAARTRRVPVVGVCRGMEVLLHSCGVRLEAIEGHVTDRQSVQSETGERIVNSYHRLGARETGPELIKWARSSDGVVKGVRHVRENLVGLMWHPERLVPFADEDLDLFRKAFLPRAELAA